MWIVRLPSLYLGEGHLGKCDREVVTIKLIMKEFMLIFLIIVFDNYCSSLLTYSVSNFPGINGNPQLTVEASQFTYKWETGDAIRTDTDQGSRGDPGWRRVVIAPR